MSFLNALRSREDLAQDLSVRATNNPGSWRFWRGDALANAIEEGTLTIGKEVSNVRARMGGDRKTDRAGIPGKTTRPWRVVAAEVTEEKDLTKLTKLVEELNRSARGARCPELTASRQAREARLMPVGKESKVARCPYCATGTVFKVMRVLENGRQICERCGHIVFPEDRAFWCPCQKCLEARLSPRDQRMRH